MPEVFAQKTYPEKVKSCRLKRRRKDGCCRREDISVSFGRLTEGGREGGRGHRAEPKTEEDADLDSNWAYDKYSFERQKERA